MINIQFVNAKTEGSPDKQQTEINKKRHQKQTKPHPLSGLRFSKKASKIS